MLRKSFIYLKKTSPKLAKTDPKSSTPKVFQQAFIYKILDSLFPKK
jgi:hypothetical protein